MNKERLDYIKTWAGKKTCLEIAVDLGLNQSTVNKYIKELGLPRYKDKMNVEFFDTWSHESAYVFGYFLGDGSFYKINREGRVYEGISIVSTELKNIEAIRDMMAANITISKYQPKNKSWNTLYNIRIQNPKIVGSLKRLGVCEYKTVNGIELYPKIPVEFQGDFLRGLFDSDGSISKCSKGKLYFAVTGESMERYVLGMLPQGAKIYTQKYESGFLIKRITFYKESIVRQVFEKMYESGIYGNERKRNKFQEIYGW